MLKTSAVCAETLFKLNFNCQNEFFLLVTLHCSLYRLLGDFIFSSSAPKLHSSKWRMFNTSYTWYRFLKLDCLQHCIYLNWVYTTQSVGALGYTKHLRQPGRSALPCHQKSTGISLRPTFTHTHNCCSSRGKKWSMNSLELQKVYKTSKITVKKTFVI